MIKELLPPSIAVDENITKLAESTEGVFSFLFSEAGKTLIYSRIDELPEEVLDILAWQFHIEGYEFASTIEEKKRLIKNAIELHRHKGTRWAVEKALEALGVDGAVEEWFKYGGEPYHFKVLVSGIKEEAKWNEVRKAIDEYKNVRSWYDIIAHNKTFGDLKIGSLTTHGYRYELFLDVRLSSLQGIHTLGAKPYSAYSYSILPYSPSLSIENSTFSTGSAIHMAIKMEVATHG